MLFRGIINLAMQPDAMRIFVWDGPFGNAQRRTFYPKYKLNRAKIVKRPDVYAALEMMRKLLGMTPAWQWHHKDFEGDDGIAALVTMFPKDRIEILSTDRDLRALTAGGRVTCIAKPYAFPDHFVRLYKLTVGDVSDNIGGIPGFGEKTWESFPDKHGLAHALDKAEGGLPWAEQLFPARINEWLKVEGPTQLPILRRVIDPLSVSDEQMNSALSQGTNNPEAREALLQEYFL